METSIPKHIAIIMDGNGRWAKEKGKLRVEGHKKGAENIEKIEFLEKNVIKGDVINVSISYNYIIISNNK